MVKYGKLTMNQLYYIPLLTHALKVTLTQCMLPKQLQMFHFPHEIIRRDPSFFLIPHRDPRRAPLSPAELRPTSRVGRVGDEISLN